MIDRQKIVTVRIKGPYTGKPRPWLVIQSNAFVKLHSVTLCMLTSTLVEGIPMLRIDVQPSDENGLDRPSQVQIDKIVTVPRDAIDQYVGRLEDHHMRQVEDAVSFFLDLNNTVRPD